MYACANLVAEHFSIVAIGLGFNAVSGFVPQRSRSRGINFACSTFRRASFSSRIHLPVRSRWGGTIVCKAEGEVRPRAIVGLAATFAAADHDRLQRAFGLGAFFLFNRLGRAEGFPTRESEQARVVINQWLRQYNHTRPHQALSMRPPVPELYIEVAHDEGAGHARPIFC